MRTLSILLVAVLLLGWWLAHPSSTLPRPDPSAIPACPLPPQVAHGDAPLQTGVPHGLTLPGIDDATLTPLAGFSVDARVLGREDYRLGREADFSPTDLALGWGRMTDDAVLARLSLSQGGRWYHYRWQGDPPIPVAEIGRSSANMHMVPADDRVAAALARIEAGQRVRIDGWLIRIDGANWHWRSSLTRDDSGGGACELVYACAVTRL
ncbi:hypothetical protein H9L17_11800 [Thermomonas brevis]|uniref:Uncharacterized protein n=1 Tax=Thermomonas brevis TaxID=215691 RepID=A0A7G9QXZ1_9GAMM|nr:hypothetical protein H9L17_11800 [Thermomonas brevis]